MADKGKIIRLSRELEEQQSELVLDSLGEYFREESMRRCEELYRESVRIEIPEALDFRLRQITRKYEEAERAAERKVRRKKYLRASGLLLAVMVCAGGVSLITSDAWRLSVHNVLFVPGDGNMNIEFKESNSGVVIPEDIDMLLYPDFLPEGYMLTECGKEDGSVNMLFLHEGTDDVMTISYKEQKGEGWSDAGNDPGRAVFINGRESVMKNSEFNHELIFQLDSYIIQLSCSKEYINEDSVIQIAESINSYSTDELNVMLKLED